MQEYCGINLKTKSFYIGSTKELSRRLQSHEKSNRVGDQVFWLIGDDHDDPQRGEEQHYLNFYFNFKGCLNLSPSSQLGNAPPLHSKASEKRKNKLRESMKGNTNGSSNRGGRFFYDPDTFEVRRVSQGEVPPEGWKLGNPKANGIKGSGFSWWKDRDGRKVRVYPGDDTSGLTPPAYARADRAGQEVYNAARRKQF